MYGMGRLGEMFLLTEPILIASCLLRMIKENTVRLFRTCLTTDKIHWRSRNLGPMFAYHVNVIIVLKEPG